MAVNWYRFKIELSAYVWKVCAGVLTVLVYAKTVAFYGPGWTEFPLSLSWFAYHTWSVPAIMWTFVAFLWVCYWRAFTMLRADRRYGTR